MTPPIAGLQPVDRIEITTLVDNYSDVLLESSERVARPPRAKDGNIERNTFLAEHGLSLLVTVWREGKRHRILLDTGYTGIPLIHNAEFLGLDLAEVEALVVSHSHMDHTGALNRFLDHVGKPLPVVVHPDGFLHPRFLIFKDGRRETFPAVMVRTELEARGIEVVESKGPVSIAGGTVLVSGEVERRTGFEKGMPHSFVVKDGKEVRDPIPDDQSVVMHLRGKGLVVVSGCSHAGIINTILHARRITGEEKVCGVMGGFHLSGPAYEKVLDPTIGELKAINPDVLVPMHCTGWSVINRLAREFPSSMILNSVGSTVIFNS
jgi:7,8-dihydropterin-6-yl-methyl-4-(beta-D-ribofuranosyl)aminobenzene 5'-phosphate synthase